MDHKRFLSFATEFTKFTRDFWREFLVEHWTGIFGGWEFLAYGGFWRLGIFGIVAIAIVVITTVV